MALADELNKLVKAKGLNKNRIANHLGVNRSSVGHWLNGTTIPADEHVGPLAELLGVPASRLRRLAGEDRAPLADRVAVLDQRVDLIDARVKVIEAWLATQQ